MSQSYIEETNRTEQEKIAIITQNLLISEYFKTVFGIFPYDISRDKDSHIVVLSFEKDDIDAFTIGIDNKTKQIAPFHVGRISFDTYNYDKVGEIDIVGIHPAFMRKGLGTILLQSAENYIKNAGKKEITLDAIHNYEDMSKAHKSLDEILSTMPKEKAEKYIAKNFCDVNQYLYTTMGYVKLGDGNRYATVMKKNKLQQISIAYGLSRPLSVSTSKKQFPISLAFEDIIFTAQHGRQKNFFVNTYNALKSEDFSPFKFNATVNDLMNFHNVVMHINPTNEIYKDRLFHSETYMPIHSSKYSNIEKLSQSISSYPKLDRAILIPVNELYHKCLNGIKVFNEEEPEI